MFGSVVEPLLLQKWCFGPILGPKLRVGGTRTRKFDIIYFERYNFVTIRRCNLQIYGFDMFMGVLHVFRLLLL